MLDRGIKYIIVLCFSGIPLFVSGQAETAEQQIEELIAKAEDVLKSDPSRAIYYSNLAIVEAQKIEDKSHIAMAQATLGEAYMKQGDFDMGFETLTNAIENCPPDSIKLQAYIYVRLAGAYLKLKDLNLAFSYVDKAAAIYKSLNDSLNLAQCLNSKGLVYVQVPDNEKAEENFKAALKINRQIGGIHSIASNLNNLCLYEGNTQEKTEMLYEAISINKSLGKVWSLGENYNNLGTQYYYAHDYTKALAALDTAMRYARQINAKELISDNHRYISWVYAAKKEFAKAYEYLNLLYETEQELLTMNEMRHVELSLIQKRLKDKEQQMIMQEQAFQIRDLRRSIYIAILTTVLLFLGFFYAFLRYSHRKKIQALEHAQKYDAQEKELIALKLRQAESEAHTSQQELEYSKNELTNFAFFVRSRNDILANIQALIKDGYKRSGQDAERHLRSINAYIARFHAHNTETEILIDKVNAEFIQKLSLLHPDLSKNEKQLASLLRIGLSTKEIASIIDSTPKTVNMARYRLRKHLNLETDESLAKYMQNI
jgi:tetratricopeptide (TPR) repeat protein